MSWIGHAICLWVLFNAAVLAVLVGAAEIDSRERYPDHFG